VGEFIIVSCDRLADKILTRNFPTLNCERTETGKQGHNSELVFAPPAQPLFTYAKESGGARNLTLRLSKKKYLISKL